MSTGLIQTAEASQRRAADPGASAWVGANAGTGKTKVLTDRVLNLLLTGTAPDRILCLTFTKAAAAEMSNRLADKLSKWAVMDDATLAGELTALRGTAPDAAALETARRLFARVLDVPGGMKIETIHAFCQALLRRFPLEAGVSPHFEVLEDRDAATLLHEAREAVLVRARAETGTDLAQALAVVVGHVHESKFPDLMNEISAARGRLRRLLRDGRGPVVERLRARLGLPPGATPRTVLERACTAPAVDEDGLRRLCTALAGGGKSDVTTAEKINTWLAADAEGRIAGFDSYCTAFLTQKGEPRSQAKFPTKTVKEGSPDVLPIIDAETERVLRAKEMVKAATTLEATAALLTVADALIAEYESRKAHVGKMDFDDLILAARRLLASSEAAAWVLYKLDGGLDHVLIDEAQDTNPDQWAVVQGLVEEFFAGAGAREHVRTVFAVGDRKQSIYSFQGADPAEFERMRALFNERVPAAEGRFENVTLDVSFRSTRAVLEVVDAVFRRAPASDGVVLPEEGISHLPFRDGQAGLVELWPPLPPTEIEEPDPWKPPVERIRGESAPTRLATLVAARIAAMVHGGDGGGEMLESKGRPIRPGDILVLVRRRGPFVEDLVRALKQAEVPVAGVDRMVLTEQLAVMDLMALGQVLLLPEDDLTLACVLKGPLIGFTEEQLFEVAHGRPKGVTLWRRLREKSEHPGPFRDAYRTLRDLMEKADFLPPHELFATILGPLGGRKKLLSRLGPDAADPLDEFMALTLVYDRGHPPSLQSFLHWLEAGAQEIKRDLEEGGDAVRVMTVHGSKGLQAPIVFLPDTRQVPTQGPTLHWDGGGDDALVVWPPKAEFRETYGKGLNEAVKAARLREYRRLLYVALTRAEDRLYVCGWDSKRPQGLEECWYTLVKAALEEMGTAEEDPWLAAQGVLPSATVWRHRSRQVDAVTAEDAVESGERIDTSLPDWIAEPAPAEPTPPRPLAPSRPAVADPPARSPLAAREQEGRFQRGRLVHRLLQSLPDLPPERRGAAARAFLARPVWGLSDAAQAALAEETLAVLEHPDFAALFGPGSMAEVPLTGVVKGHVVSGQVDRLLVTGEAVTVIDYKTNRPPPRQVDEVPEAYLYQMAAYRAVLAQLYPGRPVRCALLWTDGPFLMDLPGARLDGIDLTATPR